MTSAAARMAVTNFIMLLPAFLDVSFMTFQQADRGIVPRPMPLGHEALRDRSTPGGSSWSSGRCREQDASDDQAAKRCVQSDVKRQLVLVVVFAVHLFLLLKAQPSVASESSGRIV